MTTEGYPGARFHGGCEVVDRIERLAIERAKVAFGARFANVQPHSGSSANEIVMFAILEPGDKILGMDLGSGGHLTHGSRASISGRVFDSVGYGVGPDGRIDHDQVARLAEEHRPKLIIAGASRTPGGSISRGSGRSPTASGPICWRISRTSPAWWPPANIPARSTTPT